MRGQRPRLADAEFAGDAITFTRQVFVVPAGGAFIRITDLVGAGDTNGAYVFRFLSSACVLTD